MDLSFQRFRPLRTTSQVRDSHVDVALYPGHFVQPYFVVSGTNVVQPISTMHGVERYSPDVLVSRVEELLNCGVDKVLLFGVVDGARKSADGSYAWDERNPVLTAIAELRSRFPELEILTDVCLCAYTDHGHCGVLQGDEIVNDETIPLLAKMAKAHVEAGADVVAPSAMMDGQVAAIRKELDRSGFKASRILGYSAKYASKLYGPFRDAADSAPSFGDRKSYQMDFRNASQALAEIEADVAEGAWGVMVKPSHWYQDVIRAGKSKFPEVPMAAYQVSGEYQMIRLGAQANLFRFEDAYLESLYALRRSGADLIITYASKEAAHELAKSL